jgi:hypothetical protein
MPKDPVCLSKWLRDTDAFLKELLAYPNCLNSFYNLSLSCKKAGYNVEKMGYLEYWLRDYLAKKLTKENKNGRLKKQSR